MNNTPQEFEKKLTDFFVSENLDKMNLIKIKKLCGAQNLSSIVSLLGAEIGIPVKKNGIDDALVNLKTGKILRAFETGVSKIEVIFDDIEDEFKTEIIRKLYGSTT